jgi:hypothetical protein
MKLSGIVSRRPTAVAASLVACLGLVNCGGSGSSAPSGDAGAHGNLGEAATNLGSSSGGASEDAAMASDDASPGEDSSADATPVADGSTGDATLADAAPSTDDGAASMTTCQAPDGGAACDPGLVSCGGSSCTTSNAYCCVGGGDGGSNVCTAYNSASCPSGNLTVACDETADCATGVCCEEVVGLGVPGPTQCMSSCPSNWFQICKSNTECGGGSDAGGLNQCIRQTCTQPPGLLTQGSSVVVEACAVPAPPGLSISLGGAGSGGALQGCVAQ